MLAVLREKEDELAQAQSWQGIAKLVAAAVITLLGVCGTAYSIYGQLIPWIYGVSIVAIGVGGALFKKFWLDRTDGSKVVEECRECQAAVAPGTHFRQFLESRGNQPFSLSKVQQAHQQYKLAASELN
jgi:hypothetical protein